jgi:hypothetical protein
VCVPAPLDTRECHGAALFAVLFYAAADDWRRPARLARTSSVPIERQTRWLTNLVAPELVGRGRYSAGRSIVKFVCRRRRGV